MRTGEVEFQKVLLQLDSTNQYDHFEGQHAYVSMNIIKEVMRIQRFLHLLIPISYKLPKHVVLVKPGLLPFTLTVVKLTLVHEGFMYI